jgi:hypothetical protein
MPDGIHKVRGTVNDLGRPRSLRSESDNRGLRKIADALEFNPITVSAMQLSPLSR